ncbi:MAG: hypothetical protein ABW192_01300 [Sphingobium sp.]
MSYFANTSAPTTAASFASATPLLAFWMLPITLAETWVSAWTKPRHREVEQLADAGAGEQIPVPAAIQESKDSALYA